MRLYCNLFYVFFLFNQLLTIRLCRCRDVSTDETFHRFMGCQKRDLLRVVVVVVVDVVDKDGCRFSEDSCHKRVFSIDCKAA